MDRGVFCLTIGDLRDLAAKLTVLRSGERLLGGWGELERIINSAEN